MVREALFNGLIGHTVAEEYLVEVGESLARPTHRITVLAVQQAKVNALLAAFRRQPATPPSMAESLALTDGEILSTRLCTRGRWCG